MTFRRARRGAVETCTRIPAARVWKSTGCKNAFDQLLFPRVPLRYALPWRAWGLYQTRQKAFRIPVGADALIGPLHRLPSTAKPAAAKREAIQCDDLPDALRTIHHGTAVATSQKSIACPKVRPNRRLHRSADPRRARRATAPERA